MGVPADGTVIWGMKTGRNSFLLMGNTGKIVISPTNKKKWQLKEKTWQLLSWFQQRKPSYRTVPLTKCGLWDISVAYQVGSEPHHLLSMETGEEDGNTWPRFAHEAEAALKDLLTKLLWKKMHSVNEWLLFVTFASAPGSSSQSSSYTEAFCFF